MIEVNTTLYMVLWELVLVLIAAGVFITVRTVMRGRREQASIDKLVSTVKADLGVRKEKVCSLLEKKYNYSEEQLETAVKKIIREERRFYQTIVNLFKTRESALVENLNITFEDAIEPYYELAVPKASAADDAGDGDEGGENDKVVRLQEENRVLSEELRATMGTVGRMLNEYSTMFSESGEDKHDTEVLLGMFQEDDGDKSDAVASEAAPEEVSADDIDDLLEGAAAATPEESVHNA